jgi:hypothetical protein
VFQLFQDSISTAERPGRIQPLEHLEQLEHLERASGRMSSGAGGLLMKKADFRTFYRDAHAVDCLTEREKMLMGLAVAMMHLCDP